MSQDETADRSYSAADFLKLIEALNAAEDEDELLRAMSGDNWRVIVAGLKLAAAFMRERERQA